MRVVVVAGASPGAIDRGLIRRLDATPGVELAAVVTGAGAASRVDLLEAGAQWPAFDEPSSRRAAIALTRAMFRVTRGGAPAPPAGAALPARVRVVTSPGLGREETRALVGSFAPDLLVAVGGATVAPALGTTAALGVLEAEDDGVEAALAGGAPSLAVAVRSAAGLVGETVIPIEPLETVESLGLKRDLAAGALTHRAVSELARGTLPPPSPRPRREVRAVSAGALPRLRERRRRLRREMPLLRLSAARASARAALQLATALPSLRRAERALARAGRAPVTIFFHHLIANAALNHMTQPLEEFVAQVEFFRRHVDVVDLPEAVRRVREGSGRPALALTLDDGYRDNRWAIAYLRWFGIPAAFFVSIGHVEDGTPFAHDRASGFADAHPMTTGDVRQLAADGFLVGSHAVHHENFGELAAPSVEHALRTSREKIGELTGQEPAHFSFPFGQPGLHITPEAYRLAEKHYEHLYSAYGGYNLPEPGARHFVRLCHPASALESAMAVSGYASFRAWFAGNAWSVRDHGHPPYEPTAAHRAAAAAHLARRSRGGTR